MLTPTGGSVLAPWEPEPFGRGFGRHMVSGEQQRITREPWARTWPRAVLATVLICVVLFVLLAWAPDRLVKSLQSHEVSPVLRDLAVTASWLIALVIVLGGLRLLQRRGVI